MNPDRELLSFTFPARDFGRLAEKMDVLESHWVGTSDEELRWYACWHVFDPCTLNCVHCGCSRKWDLHENPSAAERANAALLLRLREFFRAIDRPTPWADFTDADEPDDECSVPIRVVLAPVLRLAGPAHVPAEPAQLPVRPAHVPREPRQLTETQLFGPMSEPAAQALGATFATDPDALVGDLESGCICIQERRRARSVTQLARLAGKVHPLCPVCNKPAKKPLADRLTDAMREKFGDLATIRTIAEPAGDERYAPWGYALSGPDEDPMLGNDIDHWNDPPPADWTAEQIEAAKAALPAKLQELSALGAVIVGPWWKITGVEPPADLYAELPDPKPVFWPTGAELEALPLEVTAMSCRHEIFDCDVTVNRLEDTGRFTADVRIVCRQCQQPFGFLGLPGGVSLERPMVSLDGTEARLPIHPTRTGASRDTGTIAGTVPPCPTEAKQPLNTRLMWDRAELMVKSAGYGPLDPKVLEPWVEAFNKIPQNDKVAISNLLLRIDAKERDRQGRGKPEAIHPICSICGNRHPRGAYADALYEMRRNQAKVHPEPAPPAAVEPISPTSFAMADLPVSPELQAKYQRVSSQILDDARDRIDREIAAAAGELGPFQVEEGFK